MYLVLREAGCKIFVCEILVQLFKHFQANLYS